MTERMSSLVALAALALPAVARGQDQATTLLQLAVGAEVVVVATALAATDPTPEWHRLVFRRDHLLKGQVDGQFALLEPAGACCGRSLFAIGPGDQRLLFLDRSGAVLHPRGGSRGVEPATAALVAAVAALLATDEPTALTTLLVDQLDDPDPRVAADAAHALVALPQLPLGASGRARIAAALRTDVERGATRATALAEVMARTADAAMLDTALPLYLDCDREDQAAMLRRALLRCRPELLVERLPLALGSERAPGRRAALLLAELPARDAGPLLQALLRRCGDPRSQLHLCEALLAAGVRSGELGQRVPAPVLDLAQRRSAAAPRFRNIDPGNR